MITLLGHVALAGGGGAVLLGGALNGLANLPDLIRGIRVALGWGGR